MVNFPTFQHNSLIRTVFEPKISVACKKNYKFHARNSSTFHNCRSNWHYMYVCFHLLVILIIYSCSVKGKIIL